MVQRKIYDAGQSAAATPAAATAPAATASAGPGQQQELEREVQQRALEMARLLSRLSEPIRSMAAHSAIHTIREVSTAQPDQPYRTEPAGTQNFGVFGLLLIVVGLALTTVFRGLGAFGMVFLGIGALICVLWAVSWVLGRRRAGRPVQRSARRSPRPGRRLHPRGHREALAGREPPSFPRRRLS
jgi:hypothetical protein